MSFSIRNPKAEFRNRMVVDFEEDLAGAKG